MTPEDVARMHKSIKDLMVWAEANKTPYIRVQRHKTVAGTAYAYLALALEIIAKLETTETHLESIIKSQEQILTMHGIEVPSRQPTIN